MRIPDLALHRPGSLDEAFEATAAHPDHDLLGEWRYWMLIAIIAVFQFVYTVTLFFF